MPISVRAELRRPTEAKFARMAYEVVGQAFRIHSELGRFFDEDIYQRELAGCVADARMEVPVDVVFGDFQVTYYLDLLVAGEALFELKTVEALHDRHRGQLLNYLLLTDLPRGKLINFRPESVQHEFVNTTLRHTDRTKFKTSEQGWKDLRNLRCLAIDMLRDWGTGLDLNLYAEALTHFLGGEEQVVRDVPVEAHGAAVGVQRVRLVEPGVAFKISALQPERQPPFGDHLRRFLNHVALDAIQWINVTHDLVSFTTIWREGQENCGTGK